MMWLGCLVLAFWLGFLPICVGGFFTRRENGYNNSIVYRFMTGTMLLWALFQIVCTPCIILQKNFSLVVMLYLGVALFAGVVGCLWGRKTFSPLPKQGSIASTEKVAWIIFVLLLLLQLVCAVVLTYADGDDAFYVAVSEITNKSDTMYLISTYTFGFSGLNVRHALAPFPIWIAFLARISGFHTAIMAHMILGAYLIGLSYMSFYLMGRMLFSKKRACVPVFLDMMALLVLFGDYSFRTPENFMIARSRQGKAAIGSIVIPFLLFLLLVLLKQLEEKKRIETSLWWGLTATVTGACLCTTLGTFLCCVVLGCVGLCMLCVYKKVMPVVKLAFCSMPAVIFALLYFILDR